MNPEFLSIDDVVRIHQDQIEDTAAARNFATLGLLASAVEVAQASVAGSWLHTDLFEMASAYLFHIVQNHPFLDGNKRTGTAAAWCFWTSTALNRAVMTNCTNSS